MGSASQIDLIPLYRGGDLNTSAEVLRELLELAYYFSEKSDIFRHPLVMKIIEYYDSVSS